MNIFDAILAGFFSLFSMTLISIVIYNRLVNFFYERKVMSRARNRSTIDTEGVDASSKNTQLL